ncbi:MAG: peptidoglycan-associated lipoprotein [Desulfuromonas sp.]|nr:MAG: peptidoglycan-associated lipoprotein [Desulfuromonas sp.]
MSVFCFSVRTAIPGINKACLGDKKLSEEAFMIPQVPRLLYVMSTLLILVLFTGCAKKNVPTENVAVSTPVEVNEPIKVEPSPPPVNVEEKASLEEAGLFTLERIDFETVYFSYDSYELSPVAIDSIEKNAKLLKSDPTYSLRIEGHCDDRGSDEYNMSLGENRAMTVMNYLASLGIDKSRLTIISYGEEMPVANDRNEIAWAKNRRVEFN